MGNTHNSSSKRLSSSSSSYSSSSSTTPTTTTTQSRRRRHQQQQGEKEIEEQQKETTEEYHQQEICISFTNTRPPPIFTNSSGSVSSTITRTKYQTLLGMTEEEARLYIKENDVYWNNEYCIQFIQVVERNGRSVNESADCSIIPPNNRARVVIGGNVIIEVIAFECTWLIDK